MTRTCCPAHASGALDVLLPCPCSPVSWTLEEAYYNPQPGRAAPAEILMYRKDGRFWVRGADGEMTVVDMTEAEARQLAASWRRGSGA